MAYNTKAIKTDVNTKPIPQYYNPATDEYEALQGSGGAARHVLYGIDGNPISTDFATQTTLTAILDKIIAAPATEAKQTALNALIGEVQAAPTANTLLARLKSLEDKIDAIIAGTTPAVTTLSGSIIADTQAVPSRQQNKVEITTLLNAVSVPVFNAGDLAGTTALANLDYKGANEVYVAVNIDKQPWSAGVKTWTDYVAEGQRLFPSLKNITQTFINPHVYKLALIYSDINSIETIDNYEKALRAAYYPPGESGIRIYNKSSEVATCTVKLIRVWR